MKKGIIFDVDGTLWDSCRVVADSWNEYLERFAPDVEIRITEEDMYRVMGMTMTDIGNTLFGTLPKERREAVTEGCCVYEVEYLRSHAGKVYPDVQETFEKLSVRTGGAYHLYIVSNCQSGYIEAFLASTGLEELVEDLECFGNTGLVKGRNLLLLKGRNKLDAAVYVGDTQGDYNSTCEAGLPFILARYGFGTVEQEVPGIDSMKELPEAAAQILNISAPSARRLRKEGSDRSL